MKELNDHDLEQVSGGGGDPQAGATIRLRGMASLTDSQTPLYIIDGIPTESISDIPASEIESITVLKDASSTAIYGQRVGLGKIKE